MNNEGEKIGKVYLIGAGPGDPKLLTIKAADALRASDVIVYDYLVNPEVLVHARRDVELVYVGKRAGEPYISQSEINSILVERAFAGQVVSRLKGGDPFIFGRGGEEAEALAAAGVRWEVIPGISSGVAAAAYAGIPLTHRDHSSNVAFITGHDGRDKANKTIDWPLAASMADTLVIFMCAETIAKIARGLIAGGRAPSTPIAIIRWGTYVNQEICSGTLEDIAEAEASGSPIARVKIEPPAIAIVGDVVSLKDKLHWFGRRAVELAPAQPVEALSGESNGTI